MMNISLSFVVPVNVDTHRVFSFFVSEFFSSGGYCIRLLNEF